MKLTYLDFSVRKRTDAESACRLVSQRTGRTDATGLAHEWDVSARIVKTANLPVALADGLNPDNVAEAIQKVRPYGVHAHTGLEEGDGASSFRKK